MYSSVLAVLVVCAVCSASEFDLVTEIVEEFQRYCPYADMCYSDSNLTFPSWEYNTAPCCGSCTCSEGCEQTRNCCPDKISKLLGESEVERLKTEKEECVMAYIGSTHGLAAAESFKMVKRCPAGFNNITLLQKCHSDYNQFDFSDKLSYLPPYSNAEKKLIYKNHYCASCNGEEMSTLVQWDTKITCYDYHFTMSDVYNLGRLIGGKCKLQFISPSSQDWTKNKTCHYSIDRCNTTGLWESYDFKLESACMSYTSIYKYYKNVHCYLCNGFNKEDIESTCDQFGAGDGPPSFLALLDFNDLERDSSTKEETHNCPSSSAYDAYSDVCRQMICPRGFILNDYECVPLMKTIERSVLGTVVEIPFILIPSQLAIKESEIFDVLSTAWTLPRTLRERLSHIIATDEIRECTLNVYVKLKTTLIDMFNRMNETGDTNLVPYVSHIEVLLQVYLQESSNITTTIQELVLLFLENQYYNQYHIRFKQFGHKFEAFFNSQMTLFEKTDAMNATFDSFPPHPLIFSAIMDEFQDPVDGLSVFRALGYDGYTRPCDTEIVLQPNPFCSRLELLDSQFIINTIKKTATRDEIIEVGGKKNRVVYNFSSVIENSNGTGIFVCSEEFVKQHKIVQQKPKADFTADGTSTRRDESVILTIICLVASLVSLVLTLIIYIVLPQLRTLPGKNVMALSTCLIISYSLSLTNSLISLSSFSLSCQIIGICLHFSLLSGFLWMFICTYHMMRVFITIKERSQTSSDNKTILRYSLFAEGLSMLIVSICIIVSVETGRGLGYGGSPCYISNSKFILYFVAIPLAIVLISNIVMYSMVTAMVVRMPQVGTSTRKERNNLLIFLKLSTLTGCAWIFGFLYQFTEVLLFAYLFIVCNAGQGMFIMLSFVANKRVYGMLFKSNTYSESTTTNGQKKTATSALETSSKDEKF